MKTEKTDSEKFNEKVEQDAHSMMVGMAKSILTAPSKPISDDYFMAFCLNVEVEIEGEYYAGFPETQTDTKEPEHFNVKRVWITIGENKLELPESFCEQFEKQALETYKND